MITDKEKVIERWTEYIIQLNNDDGRSEANSNKQCEMPAIVKAEVEDACNSRRR